MLCQEISSVSTRKWATRIHLIAVIMIGGKVIEYQQVRVIVIADSRTTRASRPNNISRVSLVYKFVGQGVKDRIAACRCPKSDEVPVGVDASYRDENYDSSVQLSRWVLVSLRARALVHMSVCPILCCPSHDLVTIRVATIPKWWVRSIGQFSPIDCIVFDGHPRHSHCLEIHSQSLRPGTDLEWWAISKYNRGLLHQSHRSTSQMAALEMGDLYGKEIVCSKTGQERWTTHRANS